MSYMMFFRIVLPIWLGFTLMLAFQPALRWMTHGGVP